MYDWITEIFAGIILAGVLWVVTKVNVIAGNTEDLIEWHKPIDGKQNWKVDPEEHRELMVELRNLSSNVRELNITIKKNGSGG